MGEGVHQGPPNSPIPFPLGDVTGIVYLINPCRLSDLCAAFPTIAMHIGPRSKPVHWPFVVSPAWLAVQVPCHQENWNHSSWLTTILIHIDLLAPVSGKTSRFHAWYPLLIEVVGMFQGFNKLSMWPLPRSPVERCSSEHCIVIVVFVV